MPKIIKTTPPESGYKIALAQARADFDKFVIEAEELEALAAGARERIIQLRKTITALAALCDEPSQVEALGITEACWTVMSRATDEPTTADVEQRIAELGFDLASQKNPKASIMAVLNRFATAGKIKKRLVADSRGDGLIVWVGPTRSPSLIRRDEKQ